MQTAFHFFVAGAFKEKLNRFTKIPQCFFHSLALAGYVQLRAKGNICLTLFFEYGRKGALLQGFTPWISLIENHFGCCLTILRTAEEWRNGNGEHFNTEARGDGETGRKAEN